MKQAQTVTGKTKVLGAKKIRDELFNPKRQENIDTKDLVEKMAVVASECVLKELHDKKKQTHEHLDSMDGRLSMKNVTDEMHKATLHKMATNDVAEGPFAGTSQQLQTFTTLSGTNASAVAQARFNGDFNRPEKELCRRKSSDNSDNSPKTGAFIGLGKEMLETAIQFALNKVKEVKKGQRESLKRQGDVKAAKLALLKEKGLKAATKEYIDKLYYYDMYNSLRCWRTADEVDAGLAQLSSDRKRLDEIKEQIRMRVLGLGWDDKHHAWSSKGCQYTFSELADHLKNAIIPEQGKRIIPIAPPVNLQERKPLPTLGTTAADVDKMNNDQNKNNEKIRDNAQKQRDELESQNIGDVVEEMQPRNAPLCDDTLVDRKIEVCLQAGEVCMWYRGEVKHLHDKNNHVNVKWTDLDDGEAEISTQRLLPSLWNKHKHGGWRFSKEECERTN